MISAETPRNVTWDGLTATAMALPLATFGFLYVFLALMTVPWIITDTHLAERGVETTADIVTTGFKKAKRGEVFYLTVRYSVAGRDYHQEMTNPAQTYWTLQPGDKVSLLYDPQVPYHVILGDEFSKPQIRANHDQNLRFFWIITSLFLAICAVTISAVRLVYDRQRKLLQWGSLASAEIIGEKERSTRSDRISALSYRFSVPGRGDFFGVHRWVPVAKPDFRIEANLAEREQILKNPLVVYDTENPKRNALYPMMWAKLRD